MTISKYDIEIFLQQQSFDYKEANGQFVTDCPYCDKEQKLYMNSSNGLFDCKSCGTKGNLPMFQKEVMGGATAVTTGTLPPDIVEYLHVKRKFTTEAVEYLGVTVDDKGNPAIREDDIVTGELKRYGVRNLKGLPNIPDWYAKGPKGVINGRILKDKPDTILVCEGHWDVLAILSYDIRFKDMVISMGGCKDHTKEVVEILKHTPNVYICFDTDVAGKEGAKQLISKIGLHCKSVKLPKNDVNDCLIAGIPFAEIEQCIESAQSSELSGSAGAMQFKDQVMDYIFNPEQVNGKKSMFVKIDGLLNGWRSGELTVLSGLTSVGKTTFSKILMANFAQQGFPSVIIPYETRPKKIVKDLLTSMAGKNLAGLEQSEILELLQKLNEQPLYFFDQADFEGQLGLDELIDYIRGQVGLHKAKFFLVDDLDYVATCTEFPRDKYAKEQKIMVKLKQLANELEIHIILVAHIKKVEDPDKCPTMHDIKGAAEITNKPDNVILVHRDVTAEDEEVKSDVTINVAKVRDDGETGYVHLTYDVDTCKYTEE